MTLRPAVEADCRNLFEWRNHPAVRQFSRDSSVIDWRAHCAWLERTLQNPGRVLLIAEQGREPIGVLRYDLAENTATVSIYLVPQQMGQGYGAALLKTGVEWIRRNYPAIERLQAEILPENTASIKAFEKAGYRPQTTGSPQGMLRYDYVLS